MGETFSRPLIADGRVTVPSDIRDELDVSKGDYLRFEVEALNDE